MLLEAHGALAQAQLSRGRGLDPILYHPAVDADGFLSVNGTQALRIGQAGFGALFDGAWKVSRIAPAGAPSTALVDVAATATLTANLGLGRGALLGITLPFQALSGAAIRLPGVYDDASTTLRSTGLGALELHAKWSLREATAGSFGAAALLRAELPTGDSSELRGGPGVGLWPAAVLEYTPFAFLRAGLELGYRGVGGHGATLPVGSDRVRYDDQLRWGAAAELSPAARWSFDFDAYGAELVHSFPKAGASAVELSLGTKYQVTNLFSLVASGAWGPTKGLQGALARVTLGVSFAPGAADLDGDGYAGRDDACPSEPEDFDGFEDGDGCPDLDNDRDGVPDVDDACINDPEDEDGVDDHDGCPERPIPDSDGDGVDDYSGAKAPTRSGK